MKVEIIIDSADNITAIIDGVTMTVEQIEDLVYQFQGVYLKMKDIEKIINKDKDKDNER